eukprot:gene6252-7785_t
MGSEGIYINVPVCPQNTVINKYFSFPSISLIFASLSLSCFIFAVIIAFKYNSVKVFNKKIRTQNISNTIWILYYLTLGLRGASNTIRYSLPKQTEEQIERIFFIASLTLHGFTALTLSLALNHQRKYRSSSSQQTTHKEAEPLIQQEQRSTKFGFFVLQHIPILILVFMIAFSLPRIQGGGEGPTKRSRAFLLLAAIFNLSNYLPLFIWAQYLPGGCPMYIMSYVDLIQIFDFASLLFFFLFLRSEYVRNVEECIWTAVSQIQDTFDFRLF